ncbi:hypothetical protein D5085_14325 [Ectothiorhodospiraceae bacterium BW-2]|nr:hypothetical protein D5085_14325 [Ectothiorhodospiraceae bacterium BW-2]
MRLSSIRYPLLAIALVTTPFLVGCSHYYVNGATTVPATLTTTTSCGYSACATNTITTHYYPLCGAATGCGYAVWY